MNKILLFIGIAIIVFMGILNTSGNTSGSEGILELAKTSDNIAKINTAIDVVGEGVFTNVLVKTSDFEGLVEQPPSSTTDEVTTYNITTTTILTYNSNIGVGTVTGPAGSILKDNNLPPDARGDGGLVVTNKGMRLRRLIETTGTHKEWINNLILSESGLALGRLEGVESCAPAITGLKANAGTLQVDFLKWVFGDGVTLAWNSYQTDRIVAIRHINVDNLSGLDKNNKTISALVDPNRAKLFSVFNINNTNFQTLKAGIPAGLGITAGQEERFIYDLASHLNQVVGGKTLIIPMSDNTQIKDADGNPIFILD